MDLWADLQAMLVPVLLALIPITILVMTVSGCVTPAPGRAEGGEKAMTTQVLDSSAVWGVLLTLAAFGPGGAHQQAHR